MVTAQTVAKQRAEHGRNDGAADGQDQSVPGGVQRLGVVQQYAIPFCREPLPACAEARRVERINDDDGNRRVKEKVERARGQPKREGQTPHNTRASPVRAEKRAWTQSTPIITPSAATAMAEPNGQSRLGPNCC